MQDERAELEGLTCAASLRASAEGVLQLWPGIDRSVGTGHDLQAWLAGPGLRRLPGKPEALKRDVATFRSAAATPPERVSLNALQPRRPVAPARHPVQLVGS
jgi:hypothetical protein